MLIRYPPQVSTQKVRENQLTGPSRHCIYAYTKAMALLKRITREITLKALAPSSYVFIVSICLEDRNVFARIDEIPSMTL